MSKNQLRLPATLARSFLLEPQHYDSRIFPQPGGTPETSPSPAPSLASYSFCSPKSPSSTGLPDPSHPAGPPSITGLSFKASFSQNSLLLPRSGLPSAPPPGCVLHFFFLFEAFIFFFWLHQVFIAVHAFSLAVDNEGYSQAAAHGFLTAVISLGLRHRLQGSRTPEYRLKEQL